MALRRPFPASYPGVCGQKVGFARALAVEPELLCLDEPFSALDVLSAESLRGELLELWTSGALPTKAILMVTHNIEEATLLADRIVVMDKGPGRVVAEVKVELPHPRQRKAPPFLEVMDQVYAMLAGQTQPEHVEMGTAPGEAGQTRALPHIAISDLAGLLEHVHEAPTHHVDIYKLATELKVHLDALLRLTETAELLGFATVAQGDITLTPLGETFAEASILARKEIFATRIRRLPMFQMAPGHVASCRQAPARKRRHQHGPGTRLHPRRSDTPGRGGDQLGRYAELLAYDDTSETLYLETGSAAANHSLLIGYPQHERDAWHDFPTPWCTITCSTLTSPCADKMANVGTKGGNTCMAQLGNPPGTTHEVLVSRQAIYNPAAGHDSLYLMLQQREGARFPCRGAGTPHKLSGVQA